MIPGNGQMFIRRNDRGMKFLITYTICGTLTAILAVIEKVKDGQFDIGSATENDEVAIGRIALLWWLYLYQRFIGESEE